MPANKDVITKILFNQIQIIMIVATVCVVLALCMVSRNVARYSHERIYVYIGIVMFSLTIISIWVIVFLGALHDLYGPIYFAWAIWTLLALCWMFFIVGCISPTRCSESLWLIENKGRLEFQIENKIDYYYHNYHEPLPDRLPKNLQDDEHRHSDIVDIPYVTNYVEMIEFIKYYIPWKSTTGCITYFASYTLVLVFFVWTSYLLYIYAGLLYKNKSNQSTRQDHPLCKC